MLEARDLFEETVRQINKTGFKLTIAANFSEDRAGEYYMIKLYIDSRNHYEIIEYTQGDERADFVKDRAYIKLLSKLITSGLMLKK